MKTYRGMRVNGLVEVTVFDEEATHLRRPLEHRVRHSPDGFEWGYGGSGPTELAKDILWDLLGEEPDRALYMAFRESFIATIQTDSWFIPEADIRRWLRPLR